MKNTVITITKKTGAPFENGIFGINTEITRRGFFSGISSQMLNNRKFYAGEDRPCGWECAGYEFIKDRREESLCGSNFVILDNGSVSQQSYVISLDPDSVYEAAVWIRPLSEISEITFGVSGAQRTFRVVRDGERYRKFSFVFRGTGTDNGNFEVSVKGRLCLFEVSLLPTDSYYGMRRDVIRALKYISPTSLRFPGGCSADLFNWKQSLIAPEFRVPSDGRSKKIVFPDTFDQDCQEICVNEFIMLCRELNAEPELTVSLVLSDSEDAHNYVEYCNGGPDTEYGAKRQALGFDAFGVKYWYIGNEAYFSGHQYSDGRTAGQRTAELIAAMKRADPTIIPIIGLAGHKGYDQWDLDFISGLDSECRYVSYHNYIYTWTAQEDIEELYSDGEDSRLDFYKNGLFGTNFDDISVFSDEWNYRWGQDSSNLMLLSNTLQFHFIAGSGEKYHVRRAHFFMPVNEGMITVKGRECRIESSGEMFLLMQGHRNGTVLECDHCKDLDILCTDHGDYLYMSVVNRSSDEYALSVKDFRIIRTEQIAMKEYSLGSNEFEMLKDNGTLRPHGIMFLVLEK